MNTMASWVASGAVTLAIAVASIATAKPAEAALDSCGAGHARWAGWDNQDEVFSGAKANISVWRGAVCNQVTSAVNHSLSWVLLRSPYSHPDPGWAQTGYIRWYGSAIYNFAEYEAGYSSTFTRATVIGVAEGANPTYAASVGSDDRIHMTVDGNQLLSTPWSWREIDDAQTGGCFTPCLPVQWLSETFYANSDIPGTPTHKVRFNQMQQGRYGKGWFTATPNYSRNSVPTRWDITAPTQSSTYGMNYLSWTYANLGG